MHELAKTKCFLLISQLTYNMNYNLTVTRQYFYHALSNLTLKKYFVCMRVYVYIQSIYCTQDTQPIKSSSHTVFKPFKHYSNTLTKPLRYVKTRLT
jgi:hypothetical protein